MSTTHSGDTIAPDPMYSFDVNSVYNIDQLRERIKRAESLDGDDRVHAWSLILGDHIAWGNNKIADDVAIFNFNSAHECPNLNSKECQVPDGECYAYKSEQNDHFKYNLPFRRRQEIIWDHIDPVTFATGFRKVFNRKHSVDEVSAFRFSQSGDFRHNGDIIKADEIARRISDLTEVYTYSASSGLDWSLAEHFTVNQSNELADYGTRTFGAVPTAEDVPDDGLLCAFDASDGEIKCGDCRLCINEDAGDVYIELH